MHICIRITHCCWDYYCWIVYDVEYAYVLPSAYVIVWVITRYVSMRLCKWHDCIGCRLNEPMIDAITLFIQYAYPNACDLYLLSWFLCRRIIEMIVVCWLGMGMEMVQTFWCFYVLPMLCYCFSLSFKGLHLFSNWLCTCRYTMDYWLVRRELLLGS